MENMDKGLTKNTPNGPEFIFPIFPPKPKSSGFQWKMASLGVRSPCIQAHNRPTKLAKRRPMKFIQGLEFTHYKEIHQIVSPILNSESKNLFNGYLLWFLWQTQKKLFWNNIGFLFQLLHKLRKLVKQIGANIWWIPYVRRKKLISKTNCGFFEIRSYSLHMI